MNPLVVVGAVALLGLLASMMGGEAQADVVINGQPTPTPEPTPTPTPIPAPALTATFTSSNIDVQIN